MNIEATTPVGAIATDHPLATRVFARHGIDFCCGGGSPLEEACRKKGADLATVLDELSAKAGNNSPKRQLPKKVRWKLMAMLYQQLSSPLSSSLML